MTVQSLEAALSLSRVSEDEHRTMLPDGWQQGRGAFGGLVLGMMLDAMVKAEPDEQRVVRAFTGDLCGPAMPVETRIKTRVARRGKNQTNVLATLEQDGAIVAHAASVLATARKIAEPPRLTRDPPRPAPFETLRALDVRPPFGPVFAEHWEFRTSTALPFSAATTEPLILGWVKEKIAPSKVTAAVLLARLDSYWPAVFLIEGAPRPIATVSFMAEIFCAPEQLDPAKPLAYRARMIEQAGGYFVEYRELWDGDQPIAFNQQSFAMMG